MQKYSLAPKPFHAYLGKTRIKKVLFLVVGPLRGGGVKPPEPLKKIVFLLVKKSDKNLMNHLAGSRGWGEVP